MESSSTGVVRLQIVLKNQGDQAVVKKVTTKGHEVVEADGFTFIRKRKAPPAEDPAPSPQKQCAADEGGDGAAVHMHELQEPEADSQQQEQARRPSITAPAMSEEEVAAQLASNIQQLLPSSCPMAIRLQFALKHLLSSTAQRLDAEAESSGLTYSSLADSLSAAFGSVLQEEADCAQQLLLTSECGQAIERHQALPPLVRELSQEHMLVVYLQQQLAQVEAEEQAWLQLRKQYKAEQERLNQGSEQMGLHGEEASSRQQDVTAVTEAGAAPSSSAAVQAAPAAAATSGSPAAEGPEGSGRHMQQPDGGDASVSAAGSTSLLKAVKEEVQAGLVVQVELFSAMLSKVEALAAMGEQACAMLQATYHQDKFKSFPHVNSPAWLIRHLTQGNDSQA